MEEHGEIVLAHGGGGRLMHDLLKERILSRLGNPVLDRLDDSAVLEAVDGRLALTSDSYVVKPLFFKGGDIGKLAVCGTVNDLSVQGARPIALTLALIIEEGFALADLDRIIASVARAADDARVIIGAGDFKVVEKGSADGLFINTAGIGSIPDGVDVSSSHAKAGDLVIINGPLADHGISILCEREGLSFETDILSDCAPLSGMIRGVLQSGAEIHAMKDPTRGGLAAALCEIADNSGVTIEINEEDIPVQPSTLAACDMLGLDPLTVANEGKALIICGEDHGEKVLAALKKHRYGEASVIIGRVASAERAEVVLNTAIGGSRIIDMPYGELLPRIC
jgi:hydrogenase expression/formation protein HypE